MHGGHDHRGSPTMSASPPAVHMAEISAPPALAAHARDIAARSAEALAALQQPDGHFVFELEADATIPSEYIFLNRFLGESEPECEAELAEYIRSVQSPSHGGWPLYYGGKFNMSCSVKAYYALKMVGDPPDAPHMVRAKEAILANGGAETSNVFTRYTLAIFGQLPWIGVPAMPVELMLMPQWFPVNIWRFSYWSRTVIAPLLVVAAMRGRARNPDGVSCRELFVTPPERIRKWHHNPTDKLWGEFFLKLDRVLQPLEAHIFPRLPLRKQAIDAALAFIMPRLNAEDGLGAIFPAMANSVMAFDLIGMDHADPRFEQALGSVRRLVVEARRMRGGRPRYCQPCVSPVWDTALAAHALLEGGLEPADPRIRAACDWLAARQILDVKGDWAAQAPDLEPGGWAFQYRNDFYPAVADTAVVGMLLHRVDGVRYADKIARAARWIEGMQSANGGWGAFDIDNTADFLNSLPFADHGALLDPPTVDVTARCISFLCQIGRSGSHPTVRRGIAFLRAEQEQDGSWFGRWGTNYVY